MTFQLVFHNSKRITKLPAWFQFIAQNESIPPSITTTTCSPKLLPGVHIRGGGWRAFRPVDLTSITVHAAYWCAIVPVSIQIGPRHNRHHHMIGVCSLNTCTMYNVGHELELGQFGHIIINCGLGGNTCTITHSLRNVR